jgi:hypothetical protein
MSNCNKLSDLGPGDKFLYKDTEYIVIDTEPSGFFAGTNITDYVCALSLDTFKVMCFLKDLQVELCYYYGGLT